MNSPDLNIDREIVQPAGRILVLTGFTASGKDTIMNRLLEEDNKSIQLPSYTTRMQRPTELNGREYNFISNSQFEELLEEGAFFQYTSHQDSRGNMVYYGNKREDILSVLNGHNVIWRISIDAAANAEQIIADSFEPETANSLITRITKVFVGLDRLTVCMDRARNREGGMSNAELLRRLRVEMEQYYMYADRFANIISNTDLDQSVSTINSVLNGQQ